MAVVSKYDRSTAEVLIFPSAQLSRSRHEIPLARRILFRRGRAAGSAAGHRPAAASALKRQFDVRRLREGAETNCRVRARRAAGRAGGVLLAFRAAGEGPVRRPVRRRLRRRAARYPSIPVFIGRDRHADHVASTPEHLFADPGPCSLGMAAGAAGAAAARADCAEPRHQPGDRRQCHQPDPLAEPLARGAPVLGVLPERLRRPHRQPRDADRPGDAREPGRAAHRGLVHPGLRHQRGDPARLGRPLAGAADPAAGSPAISSCCASSCRACATARRTCRRRARC